MIPVVIPDEVIFFAENENTNTPHKNNSDTADGSEILHPPVGVGSVSHYYKSFYTSQVVSRISEPSTVVI